jgi:succinoglycan biosynthesis protein ExoA
VVRSRDEKEAMTLPPGHRPLVSVIIPARNEGSTIERAIAPLLSGPVDADVEVIVADGGSTDGTRDVVLAIGVRDPRVRLVDNPAKVTPDGLNAAIRASRGGIIVRMDGHAEPDPDYLAACLAALGTSGAWNVGGQMRKVSATRAGRAASAATTSPFGIGGGRRFHLLTEAVDVDTVWLGCWPRWVFERVGLFDPEMIQDQDEELNQRIVDAGGRVRFVPSISATYASRASWRGLLRQYYRYGLFKVRGIQKRPSVLRARHLVPAGFVAVVVVGLAGTVVAPWAGLVAAGTVAAWLLAAVWFGRQVAGEFGATVPEVVAAYGCLHVGYGVGMWAGLVRFAPRWFVGRRGTIPTLEPRVG